MDFTGEIKSISQDFETGQFNVTVAIDNSGCLPVINYLKGLCKDKISVKVSKFRNKRSLDANAYAWVLMTKIANHPDVKSSKEEVYEDMLQKYGFLDEDEEGYIVATVKASVDIARLGGHWKFYKGNGKFNSYLAIKGSSKYNTAEMAHFIDQIVLEAQELDIETVTPKELDKMKALWGERYEKAC